MPGDQPIARAGHSGPDLQSRRMPRRFNNLLTMTWYQSAVSSDSGCVPRASTLSITIKFHCAGAKAILVRDIAQPSKQCGTSVHWVAVPSASDPALPGAMCNCHASACKSSYRLPSFAALSRSVQRDGRCLPCWPPQLAGRRGDDLRFRLAGVVLTIDSSLCEWRLMPRRDAGSPLQLV